MIFYIGHAINQKCSCNMSLHFRSVIAKSLMTAINELLFDLYYLIINARYPLGQLVDGVCVAFELCFFLIVCKILLT